MLTIVVYSRRSCLSIVKNVGWDVKPEQYKKKKKKKKKKMYIGINVILVR